MIAITEYGIEPLVNGLTGKDKSWLADLTNGITNDARSNTLIESELMNSLWHRVRSIGVETTYEASGAKQGQSVLLEGSFVHGLIYL